MRVTRLLSGRDASCSLTARGLPCRLSTASRRTTRARATPSDGATAPPAAKKNPFPYPTRKDLEEAANCQVSLVVVDNKSHPKYSVLEVQAPDTPGLLRVVSWVLNGMSVRVHHGVLRTSPDGVAKDVFWVTDFKSRKLKDDAADALGARLEDFLIVCTTPGAVAEQQEWLCGPIQVSNAAHPDYTQVIITGEPHSNKPGFLLELSSALTAVGASIMEAVIQGDSQVPHDAGPVGDGSYDFSSGRIFKFLLVGPNGGKMDADRVASLIYTLRLLSGKGVMPTVAPNMEALLQLHGRC